MSKSAKPQDDFRAEAPIPQGAAPLESILCTEDLERRPARPPDYGKENRALVALVSALADSPRTIFRTLAETILDVTQSDSAGLSLLTRDGKRRTFTAKDCIDRRLPARGIPTSEAGPRAISALRRRA